jgi:NADH-quinone oxidoreductase subunit J
VFYVAGAVALVSTLLVITRTSAVHALLYLVVSLLAVAIIFYDVGAPFVAALEVIIYAGAIMVIFVFVLMMLDLGPRAVAQERAWLRSGMWIGPGVLAAILAAEVIYTLAAGGEPFESAGAPVAPKLVGDSLFGLYFIGVELASLLLLAGLVGGLHLARAAARKDG